MLISLCHLKLNTFVIHLSLYGANKKFLIPVCWIEVSGVVRATLTPKQARTAMTAQPEYVVKLLSPTLAGMVCLSPT